MPRQSRSRALVDAIVEAGTLILVQQGRDALTTNAVAMRAGVSVGSLYQYFPNRQAILTAVAASHLDDIHRCVASTDVGHARCLAEAIRQIIAGLFAAHRINPALHLALAREIGSGDLFRAHVEQPDAKAAVLLLFASLDPSVREEIVCRDIDLAINVAAEIAHALAHAAIDRKSDKQMMARLEQEAVTVVMTYFASRH